jgi:hypothetical protein
MATQYTPSLKLALPVTGELSGTWGDVVNDNITSMIEQAVAGLATINTWTANVHTLTVADGTTSESRCAVLVAADGAGGTALTAAGEIVCSAVSKLYVLKNGSSYAVTLKTSSGTGIAVPAGQTAFLFCDATNVNACVTTVVNGNVSGNLSVNGNLTVDGNTTLGNATSDTITATGRFDTDLLPSTDNARDLGSAANSWRALYVDGTVAFGTALTVANGGTGATTLTGVVKGNGTSAFTAGSVNLASEVTGTLPLGNGGTGQTTAQAAINSLAGATTSGQYLRGNGSNVVMSAIQAGDVPTLNQNTTGTAANVTGTVAVANGGTGQTTYTNGQLLIGNTTGNTLSKATLTAGSNITITNGAGTITIASTGGGGGGGATTYTGTVAAASWTGSGPYTQTVTVTGVASGDTVILDLDLSSAAFADVTNLQFAYAQLYRAVPGTNTMTLYATAVPSYTFDIYATVI